MKLKSLLLILCSLINGSLLAQTKENPFYSNGKIYVVVTILCIIFTGIILFLIRIDRRLKRTERELKGNSPG